MHYPVGKNNIRQDSFIPYPQQKEYIAQERVKITPIHSNLLHQTETSQTDSITRLNQKPTLNSRGGRGGKNSDLRGENSSNLIQ